MLTSQHLFGIKYLERLDIQKIFQQADIFREVLSRPQKKIPALRGFTIANLFFENSTRTRTSFEMAAKLLSADVINFNGSSSSVSKGETMLDTVKNILAMKVDMIIIRSKYEGTCEFLSKYTQVRILNAGDGTNEHPTQALLNAYSLIKRLGTLENKTIGIVGDILHSRVARSDIYCLKKLGARVILCAPPMLIPDSAERLEVQINYDLKAVVNQCDALNVLRVQNERLKNTYIPSVKEYSLTFGLHKQMIDELNRDIIIMHPGPINRGVELTSDVADSKNSIILEQVENGLAVRMAVIYLLSQASITT